MCYKIYFVENRQTILLASLQNNKVKIITTFDVHHRISE